MIYLLRVLLGGIIMRIKTTLKCTVCNNENYHSKKNKKLHPDRMETKKFCPTCRAETVHKEKK